MGFGGINTGMKAKSIQNMNLDSNILVDHFDANESEYYMFLIEGMPADKKDLKRVQDQIDNSGYKSYLIVSATNGTFKTEDVKQKTEYMLSNRSNFIKLINYKGKHVSAIMAFGCALYSINKGTDLLVNEFYETKMMKPYYYLGSGFIGNYNTFIFPVDSIEELYPKESAKGKPFRPDESVINWKTRFFFEQLQNMQKHKDLPDDMRPYKIITALDHDSIENVLKNLLNSDLLAWDTETTSLNHEEGLLWYRSGSSIHCFTFSNDGETGYYCDAKTLFQYEDLKKLLIEVMYTCNRMVGANIKFDLHYLMWHIPEFDMFKCKKIEDTGQLIHAINSEHGKGLKGSAFRFTYMGGYDDQLDVFKKQTKIEDYGLIPFNILHKYATIDAIVTWRIYQAERKLIKWIDEHFPNEKNDYLPENDQWTMERWYDEVMQAAYPYFVEMEHRGMNMDYEYMKEVRERLEWRIPKVAHELAQIWNVPDDFMFGSTDKLGKQIEKMGWPKVEESKSGGYATNDDCIQEWRRQKMPGIEKLIEWRLLNSIYGTFIGFMQDENQNNAKGWEFFITKHNEDNSYRVHQSYQIMGTTTYRCIGNDPNLQNIPVHADIANEVKRCITVPTSEEYHIQVGNDIIVGGGLDSIETEERGRVLLSELTENDTPIVGTLEKFKYEHQEVFDELKDEDLCGELREEYGDIEPKWAGIYQGKGYRKLWDVIPVGRRIIQSSGGRRIILQEVK